MNSKIFKLITLSTSLMFLIGCDAINNDNQNDVDKDETEDEEDSNISQGIVTLDKSEVEVEKGKTVKLTAVSSDSSPVKFISTNEYYATIDSNGIITGKNVGSCKIIAKSNSDMKTCDVKVISASSSTEDYENIDFNLTETSLILDKNTTHQLHTTIDSSHPNYLKNISYKSSSSTVATVNSTGLISTVGYGECDITATTKYVTRTCHLTVKSNTPVSGKGTLVFQDEFDLDHLDTSIWSYQNGTQDVYGTATGPADWGNNEEQYYTSDSVKVSDGLLNITASKTPTSGKQYKSGRICSRDKKTFTYGYFEARMKTPAIDAMWPAFWMLPQPSNPNSTNNEYGGWASNGEIDIMEAKGREKNVVLGTLHYHEAWPNNLNKGGSKTLSTNTDEFHTYACEWKSDHISFFVDEQVYVRFENSDYDTVSAPTNPSAPFDKPFYLIFNLAVGGNFDPGITTPSSFTSASMQVDYIRVYQ